MIYEYKCTRCGNVFSAEQKITDDPLKDCHQLCCVKYSNTLQRLISGGGFILKGDRWEKKGGY